MLKQFIITIKQGVDTQYFSDKLQSLNVQIDKDYDGLKRMFLVSMDESLKAQWKQDDDVFHVAPAEAPVTLLHSRLIEVDSTARGGNWGLARISVRHKWNKMQWYPTSGTFKSDRTGVGVHVYVVDTGIRLSHHEFQRHASVIFDAFSDSSDPRYGSDENGHGTHVASIIGGQTFGVAPNCNIFVAKVFSGSSGTLRDVIDGINACVSHHLYNGQNAPAVMNLSLGGTVPKTEEQAINDVISAGIVVIAAGGNDNQNLDSVLYEVWPAEIDKAVTVGATDIKDRKAWFSNYGSKIDIWAPGTYICGAGIKHDKDSQVYSGTSQAAPHVAGVCALHLEGRSKLANSIEVKQVHDWIIENATQNSLNLGYISQKSNSPNKMLFSYYGADDDKQLPINSLEKQSNPGQGRVMANIFVQPRTSTRPVVNSRIPF